MVGKIATGEDAADDDHGKNPAAVALGRKGGEARAAGTTADARKLPKRRPKPAGANEPLSHFPPSFDDEIWDNG